MLKRNALLNDWGFHADEPFRPVYAVLALRVC
ncbi:hypothetical protein HOV93_39550 [Planctomycetes bacterium FF15]|uniref:Uncharacterized protein n=1 Tax=Bremerella alba TaxID=980252 RepID=A0A7V8V8A0_9BACT|nr:hypothetical protein [Bremerella alba]